jgi:hypothetical protein
VELSAWNPKEVITNINGVRFALDWAKIQRHSLYGRPEDTTNLAHDSPYVPDQVLPKRKSRLLRMEPAAGLQNLNTAVVRSNVDWVVYN